MQRGQQEPLVLLEQLDLLVTLDTPLQDIQALWGLQAQREQLELQVPKAALKEELKVEPGMEHHLTHQPMEKELENETECFYIINLFLVIF